MYKANRNGFDVRIYVKGDVVPDAKVPKGGASWIDFIDSKGNAINSKEMPEKPIKKVVKKVVEKD